MNAVLPASQHARRCSFAAANSALGELLIASLTSEVRSSLIVFIPSNAFMSASMPGTPSSNPLSSSARAASSISTGGGRGTSGISILVNDAGPRSISGFRNPISSVTGSTELVTEGSIALLRDASDRVPRLPSSSNGLQLAALSRGLES